MAHKKFSELRAKMSPGAQDRAQARAEELLRDMALADLRRARELTQQQLATILDVNQAWISKVERQTDMYLSTLRSYVEAAGGKLEIFARFNDSSVRLDHFGEIGQPEAEPSSPSSTSNARELQNIRVNVWSPEPTMNDLHESAAKSARVWSTVKRNTSGYRTSRTSRTTTKAAA